MIVGFFIFGLRDFRDGYVNNIYKNNIYVNLFVL